VVICISQENITIVFRLCIDISDIRATGFKHFVVNRQVVIDVAIASFK